MVLSVRKVDSHRLQEFLTIYELRTVFDFCKINEIRRNFATVPQGCVRVAQIP